MKIYSYENGNVYFEKEYLIQCKYDDESISSSMKTANEIIDMISMNDCINAIINVYDVEKTIGKIYKLNVHGTWHDINNPLYIKVTYKNGKIAFDGYGIDH